MTALKTINLAAVSRNYFNMPIWVADYCGLFEEENIQVDIELYEPIDEVTERLEKGQVQLALGVTEHIILNHEVGGSLTIIGGNVNKLPFSLIAKPSIREFNDLKKQSHWCFLKISRQFIINYEDTGDPWPSLSTRL